VDKYFYAVQNIVHITYNMFRYELQRLHGMWFQLLCPNRRTSQGHRLSRTYTVIEVTSVISC